MTVKPRKPCTHPGCRELTAGGPCPKHRREQEQRRGTAAARLYDAKWRRARAAYLAAHPFCVKCEKAGKRVAAVTVDHIIPHGGDPALFWDPTNWQSLCKSHHDQKTALHDGGFGRPRG